MCSIKAACKVEWALSLESEPLGSSLIHLQLGWYYANHLILLGEKPIYPAYCCINMTSLFLLSSSVELYYSWKLAQEAKSYKELYNMLFPETFWKAHQTLQ